MSKLRVKIEKLKRATNSNELREQLIDNLVNAFGVPRILATRDVDELINAVRKDA